MQLLNDFRSIKFGLLVGSGVDYRERRRTRCRVVSKLTAIFAEWYNTTWARPQWGNILQRTGMLKPPPTVLMVNVQRLQAQQIRSGSQIPEHLAAMLEKYPNM
jgi:hypothetical protein